MKTSAIFSGHPAHVLGVGILCLASLVGGAGRLEAAVPAAERQALEALYNATNGPSWTRSDGWLGPAGSECGWFGVTCNADQSHALRVELPGNRLAGTLPSQLGGLAGLVTLNLANNQLSGSLPASLAALPALRELRLSGNRLQGEVPAAFVTSGSTTLDLRWNALSVGSEGLRSALDTRSPDHAMLSTQTLPPSGFSRSGSIQGAPILSWTPVSYLANGGGYRIRALASGVPIQQYVTSSKSASSLVLPLSPGRTYTVVIETFTSPHAGNANEVTSLPASATFMVVSVPEPVGSVSFASPSVDLAEGEAVTVLIYRSGGAAAISVSLQATLVSAGFDDFVFTSAPLFWNVGDNGARFLTLFGRQDLVKEPTETVRLKLQAQGSVSLGPISEMTVHILDGDVSGSGSDPVAGRDLAGNLLYAWVGTERNGTTAIFGRFADADGRLVGDVFQISEPSSAFNESSPAVTSVKRDFFEVVWQNQRGAVRRCVVRIRGGVDLGKQVTISTPVAPDSLEIAGDPKSGRYAVAWSSGPRILAQLLDADDRLLKMFRVDGPTPEKPSRPSLAFDPLTHALLVAWEQPRGTGAVDVFGRVFSASGVPATGEFRISRESGGRQTSPRVVGTPAGFAAFWLGPPGAAGSVDPAATEVLGARIDPSGEPEELRVSDQLAGSQAALTATVDRNGDCVVAWLRDGAAVNGLFVKTLPGCSAGGTAETRVEVGRALRAPSLFETSAATAVVFEVEDVVNANGGVAVSPVPER